MQKRRSSDARSDGLKPYLSTWGAVALSFGCAVGWGAFVIPGTVFLPVAGPFGALVGLGIGAAVMFLVGRNYHYLIQNFPEAGGAYGYVRRICGGDHGFICGWFLILTYVAIAWANATALALIGRYFLGGMFGFGFCYNVAGCDVYVGDVLLPVVALLLVCGLFLLGKRLAVRLQAAFAVVLCAGIAVCVAAALAKLHGGVAGFPPAFAGGKPPVAQIFAVVALAPWAFVGFESVSHSAEEFAFPRWRTVRIIVASLVATTAVYVALTLIAASACPPGFSNWSDYMAARNAFDGLAALPTFYAVRSVLGGAGLVVLSIAALAAIAAGLIGHVVAASRLVYAMSRDGMLFDAFGRLDREGSPRNAIVAILAVSCLVPLVGRTAVGWILDVTTIGASIAYGYVSFCTFVVARREGRRFVMASGAAGVAVSVAFLVYFMVPNFWVVDAMAAESYFMLSAWCVVGIVVFRSVFNRDRHRRLGTTTAAWLVLLFFIFFSGHMWNRQMTRHVTDRVVAEISERYVPVDADGNVTEEEKEAESFLGRLEDWVNGKLTRYNLIQIALMLVALAVMYSIYSVISRREKEAAKAKSYFFSTISHDIRTPLNAIVGFSQMLKLGVKTKEEQDEAANSILIGSKSLLDFVNDILDLSRRGSNDAELSLVPTDCRALLRDVEEAFRVGTPKKGVEIRAAIGEMPTLLVDPLLLRHIVSNFVSNAVKFTEHGHVEVRGRFDRDEGCDEGRATGSLLVEIEDTGVGISEEDKEKIDSPYIQTESKIARNGGTGLSLAVCRQLAEEMGGEMSFDSELGSGSTFRITLPKVKVVSEGVRECESDGVVVSQRHIHSPAHPLPHSPTPPLTHSPTPRLPHSPTPRLTHSPAHPLPHSPTPPLTHSPTPSHPRVLLVDDQKLNLTVLKAMIKRVGGFEVETAADGREALARLQDRSAPKGDAVLTDMWMPELDGEGLAKAIRADASLAGLPVHVITADVELQENYAEKGFDSIILKPVTVGTLGPLLAGLAERKG